MENVLGLVEQLIAEHKVLREKAQSLRRAANDASLLRKLREVQQTFAPQGLTGQNLKRLEAILEEFATWLGEHFGREETVLKPAVKKYGSDELITSLHSLLFEHTELRDRMHDARRRVVGLSTGGLDAVHRDADARDLMTYLNHSAKLLATHAARENRFFTALRRYLKGARKGEAK